MGKFIDVTPDKWYYNEIVEASDTTLEDDEPLIVGIPYNIFEDGKPFVYKEFKASAGQKEFLLNEKVVPSKDNPLFIYINGVQTVYKSVEAVDGGTKIILYTGAVQDAIVSIASYGKPVVNEFGRPTQSDSGQVRYPSIRLKGYSNYYYSPFYRNKRENVSAFGRQLRRANISTEEWDADPTKRQEVLRKYIGYSNDTYFIAPDGILHVPYNLNGVTCTVSYLTDEGYIKVNTEYVVPTTQVVLHLDRVFPTAFITRAEAFVVIDRLRHTFYSRFSDVKANGPNLDVSVVAYDGQRSVSVQGRYEKGSGELEVFLNNNKQRLDIDYIEYDGYTVVFKFPLKEGDTVKFKAVRTKSLHLEDVGTETVCYRADKGTYSNVNGIIGSEDPKNDSWWASHILALEQEFLSNGELMVDGIPIKETTIHEGKKTVEVGSNMDPTHQGEGGEYWFMPNTFMTRAQAITILNRFRKLMLERFL